MITIEYRTGDMFESGADYLVCPVNCVGVMGKGLAKEFKKRYPWVEEGYIRSLREGHLHIGGVSTMGPLQGDPGIIFFATKWHWKEDSQLYMIDRGMDSFMSLALLYVHEDNPRTVAMPKLGCGLGGLDWNEVKPIIERHVQSEKNEYGTAKLLIYE